MKLENQYYLSKLFAEGSRLTAIDKYNIVAIQITKSTRQYKIAR